MKPASSTSISIPSKMKAVIATGYGSTNVFNVRELAVPTPAKNEILIQIKAASVTRADAMMRTGKPLIGRLFLGLTKPKHSVPGTGFSGTVVAKGSSASLFEVGDEVFGESISTFGAYAEYVLLPEDDLVLPKPDNISHSQAAAIPDGGVTSLNFLLDQVTIQPGQRVLINGASGSLGTAAIQIAKAFGAHVTGVCSSRNLDLVLSLGADEVIDYTTTDFTSSGETYDIIYDTVLKSPFPQARKALSTRGVYLSPVLNFSLLLHVIRTSLSGKQKALFSATGARPKDDLKKLLVILSDLLQEGKITVIIDKTYPLDQADVAQQYVETGRKRGNVVLLPDA